MDGVTQLLKYLHDVGDPRAGSFEPRLAAAGVPIGHYGPRRAEKAALAAQPIMLELAIHTLTVALSGFEPTFTLMKLRMARGSALRLASALITAAAAVVAVAGTAGALRLTASSIAAASAVTTAMAEWYDRSSAAAVQELSAAAVDASEAEFLRDLLRSYAETPQICMDLDARIERAAKIAQKLRALVIKWGR